MPSPFPLLISAPTQGDAGINNAAIAPVDQMADHLAHPLIVVMINGVNILAGDMGVDQHQGNPRILQQIHVAIANPTGTHQNAINLPPLQTADHLNFAVGIDGSAGQKETVIVLLRFCFNALNNRTMKRIGEISHDHTDTVGTLGNEPTRDQTGRVAQLLGQTLNLAAGCLAHATTTIEGAANGGRTDPRLFCNIFDRNALFGHGPGKVALLCMVAQTFAQRQS